MDAHALEVLEFHRLRDHLASRCQSEPGRGVAKSLEPSADRERIQTALRQTDEARAHLDRGESLPLTGIGSPRALLHRVRKAGRPLEPRELLELHRTLRTARDLKAVLDRERARMPSLAALSDQFLDLCALEDLIDAAIETPGRLRDRASAKLWEIRRARLEVEETIRGKLKELGERKEYRRALQNPGFTLRGGRYVFAVKLEMKGHVPGILHDHSQTGATAFIEPQAVVPLTNRLRELKDDERKEEGRILWELTHAVHREKNAFVHTESLLAWFDFTWAKALLSKEFSMRSPEVSRDGTLVVPDARHPLLLLERSPDERGEVVPVSYRLRDSFRILVVTGPNTGGKTVTLKTVGLLQLMFQAGLHLSTGEGARLPVFRDVGADIGDEQSLTQNLSTFSGHVRNIARILEGADKRSLVLLDELGAGTDPAEGAALGLAILEALRDRRAAVVVTTHLGGLKEFAYRHGDVENASVEFDAQSLKPTYRLMIGIPGNSNALEIAGRHGIDAALIDRAKELLGDGSRRAEHLIESLVESRRTAEEVRTRSEKHLQKSKNLQKAAEERHRHLEKRERRLQAEARKVLDEALRVFRSRVEPVIKQLNGSGKAGREAARTLEEALRHLGRDGDLGRRRREFLDGLRKEDRVWIPRFGELCRIRKIHRADERLTVILGGLTADVSFDDVSLVPAEEILALLDLVGRDGT